MRRKDREITDFEDIIAILGRCGVLRLGISTPDYPYVVPMNFGFERDGGTLTLWFHCASAGLKLDCIRKNNRAGFEGDCSHKLITSKNAAEFTMEYESVIGHGDIHICEDPAEKLRGLNAIMHCYAPGQSFEIPPTALSAVSVLRLDVLQITGKRNLRSADTVRAN